MRFHLNVGPFGVSSSGRGHTGPTTRQAWRTMIQSFRDVRTAFTRGSPETKKMKGLRSAKRKETTASVRDYRRDGTLS